MLPGLSGYRLCSRLREAGDWTPILMLTAKDGEYDEADGLDVGADDYLTKPFSFVVLLARLRALMRRGARDRPGGAGGGRPAARPGGAGLCARHGELALTAAEFAVLEYLMRRPPAGGLQVRDPAERVGHGVRRRGQPGRGLRPQPAPEDRLTVRPAGDPHDTGCGLSARPRWRVSAA